MKLIKKMHAGRTMYAALTGFLALVAALVVATPVRAGAGWGTTSNPAPDANVSQLDASGALRVRTYYANSPQGTQADLITGGTRATGLALRKFVDALPGLGAPAFTGFPGNLTDGTYIPVAVPDTSSYADANYYEIAVVEYTQRMHSDLARATTLRGYVQIDPVYTDQMAGIIGNGGESPAGSKHIALFQMDGTPVLIARPSTRQAASNGFELVQAYAADKPSYLGPTIIANRGTPTRIKFYNGLPSGRGTVVDGTFHRNGDLFIPTDHTLMGGGDGQTQTGFKDLLCGDVLSGPNNAGDPTQSACLGDPATGTLPGYMHVPEFQLYTENREELHLHGGDNPWISDGTPHQWITPAADELNGTVADNYRRGPVAYNVPDMAEPGPGAVTYYWPNGQSGRLMFFHDHATGLTRLNVYAGTAAGYLLVDDQERKLNALVAGEIPLVIQDKTFVPKDIAIEDAKWCLDAAAADGCGSRWGQEGDLWFPHVYETNQDPNSGDFTNPVGRWDGASFFWPVFPQTYATPSGEYGNVSTTPEAFMDTPIINGMAYPTMTVDPKAYRFRILGVGNDRMFNLSLFVADAGTVTPIVDADGSSRALPQNSEVKMVPFTSPNSPTTVTYSCPDGVTAGQVVGTANALGTVKLAGWTESGPNNQGQTLYPNSFPCAGGLLGTGWGQADNRPGGVPDPGLQLDPATGTYKATLIGPDLIRIGTEGGLVQKSIVIPATPINYEYNKRSVTVLNVLEHSLWLGAAERADLIVDFSAYAGKTLILYNDSGAPVPAGDPRIDYYTDDGDQMDAGGAPNTVAGYGPNTRTIMQIHVNAGAAAPAFNIAALDTQLMNAYVATQPKPIVPTVDYAPLAVALAGTADAFNATAPYEWIYTGAIYHNKYQGLTIPAATDKFYYTPAPKCTSTANCLTALAALRAGANNGLVQSTVGSPINAYVESKAIQELFEPDFGRMNATLGVELPFTSVNIQTTIPLAYVDPATESIAPGEVQFWKITHNGVDSHPVHFHFINVQVINRVGWDGTAKAPSPDEIGWKETVKMHPLEDIIVAVRAKTSPATPFGMPHSYRQPAPNQLPTDNHGITQLDAVTGARPTVPYNNSPVDYGSEYVWHCHILGHEENDFMRPFIYRAHEVVASAFAITSLDTGPTGITVKWEDKTPVPVVPTIYDPITNPSGFLGNPGNEIGFRIERADMDAQGNPGGFVPVAQHLHQINDITRPINATANSTEYVDLMPVNAAIPQPAAPLLASVTNHSVTLTLPAVPAGATGFNVYRNGGATPIAVNYQSVTFVDSTALAGQTYDYTIAAVVGANAVGKVFAFRVVAVTAAGETVSSNTMQIADPATSISTHSPATTVLMPPSAPAGVSVNNATVNSLAFSWTASPAAELVTSYLVSVDGAAPVAAAAPDVVTGLAPNSSHSFAVTAVNSGGTSAASATANGLTLPEAPAALTVGAITSTSIALSWAAPTNAAGLSYQVQGLPAGASVAYSATTAVVSGLASNASFSFTVVSVNATGASAASGPASGTTLPAAPTGLATGTITASSIALTWVAPANGASSYVVLGAPGSATVSTSGTTATVTGLAFNTSYTLSVAAVNSSGQGPASTPVTAKTLMVVPGVPACCTASAATPTSVAVNWIAPAAGPATSYTIQRSTNSTFPRNGGGTVTLTNVAGTSQSFTGLTSNTTYYFRVMAVNAVGSSAYSPSFSFQPPAPPPTPAAPTATAAPANTSAPTVTVAFATPASGVTYTIYQQTRTNGGATWGTATVAATGVTGTSWPSGPLAAGMQVRYYLVAVNPVANSANSQNSNTVTTQQLANAPTGLTTTNGNGTIVPATRGTPRSVTLGLGWALGAGNGTTVTSIRVLRATGASLAGNINTSNLAATTTATNVTGLAPNTTYTFQVQAVTASGVNGSSTVTITTTP